MQPRNLAEFKRFLALPGATVTMIEHSAFEQMRPEKRDEMFGPRTVQKLQTNAVQFSNGGWLQFGKAADWTFENDTATCRIGAREGYRPALKMVYRLEVK
jgi:hypothetical protein